MLKKGFTLIELLGVLMLIAVLSLVTVPIVTLSINNSKSSLHNNQEKQILKAAIDWASSNTDKLPINGTDEEKTLTITVGYLKSQGYLASSIKDPETGYLYPNDMKVNVIYDNTRNYENDNNNFAYNGNYRFEIPNFEEQKAELKQLEQTEDIDAISLNICGTGDTNIDNKINIQKCINANFKIIYKGYDINNTTLDYYDNKRVKSNTKVYTYQGHSVNIFDMSKYGFYYVYYNDSNQPSKSDVKIFMINDMEPPTIEPTSIYKEYPVGYDGEIRLLDDVTCEDNSGYCIIKTSGNINPAIKGKYVIYYIASDYSGNTLKKKGIIAIK